MRITARIRARSPAMPADTAMPILVPVGRSPDCAWMEADGHVDEFLVDGDSVGSTGVSIIGPVSVVGRSDACYLIFVLHSVSMEVWPPWQLNMPPSHSETGSLED